MRPRSRPSAPFAVSPLPVTRARRAALASLAVLLAACGGSTDCSSTASGCGGGPTVASIAVSPGTDTITVGATTLKTASPRDASGNVISSAVTTVRWTSSATAVATVDSLTGLVTGVAIGSATITARTPNAVTGTATVVVKANSTPTALSITPTAPAVQIGRAVSLTGAATNAGGAVSAVFRWSSSTPSVATIDSVTGLLTGVATGTTTITLQTRPVSVSATATATVTAASSLVAELPRVRVNSAYAAPTGAQIVVPAGGNLQAALNSANAGDEILLAPGATYTGNFTLPAKTGSGVIHIRTNIPYSSLPPEGSRMTPSLAASLNLAKIVSSNGITVIQTAVGASNYRLLGLEVTVGSTTALNSLIRVGDVNQTSLAQLSQNFVFDRMYIHGTPTNELQRAFILSSGATAIVDSWISEIHATGIDSQCIVGWAGPGPYRIENNHLQASTENINWGGADPGTTGVIPSDIEIVHNYFVKDSAWTTGPWLIKNLYESKASARVLIQYNVFQNNWQGAQAGYAINLKSTNQSGACTWCVTKDVTFRYNYLLNTGGGWSIAGSPDPFPVDSLARRVVIQDNIIDNVGVSPWVGASSYLQVIGGASDVIVDHNSMVSANTLNTSLVVSGTPSAPSLTFTNNIVGPTSFGIKGAGQSEGTNTLNAFAPGYTFGGNILVGAPTTYPGTNKHPANYAAVGFTSFATKNYLLTAGSIGFNAGTDGRSIGADVSFVLSKIAGAIVAP